MIGVDTNILVRYLTKDDEKQWKQAAEIIEAGEQCFVANIVLCELVWVLRGKPYQFSKEEISNTIELMLQCSVFELENRSLVYQALQRFKQGKADLSDYLIGAIAQHNSCSSIVTFDRKLRSEQGFNLLE
ncbi:MULTISPECIES: type II toxin-antitoxin system VapC family toxin [unclassified Nostoc]|uniref:PIN domain-containing protein n=1 Tax=unclassified Nostoc TaxID=2593658 RepID=UPI002AD23FD2|nr:type II toxin-antitoxin system VapC family toxin [Nostoc sp. DedQUE03]MDZ7972051.1 type II toxin-antitoxin system VapC family toxin [Nostoc sp. DedQUE03]MDZ8043854.1 type II toxin-antitoxin system VapC family toxin [Nostoc sp. DedQUE02]